MLIKNTARADIDKDILETAQNIAYGEMFLVQYRTGVRDEIAAALQAERDKSKWQPISTAPRDGTVIDLLTKCGMRFTDEWWDDEDGCWSCLLSDGMFSHWMPLPSPPVHRDTNDETKARRAKALDELGELDRELL